MVFYYLFYFYLSTQRSYRSNKKKTIFSLFVYVALVKNEKADEQYKEKKQKFKRALFTGRLIVQQAFVLLNLIGNNCARILIIIYESL